MNRVSEKINLTAATCFLGGLFLLVFTFRYVHAHPGRTDSDGGHTCRTNCEYYGLDYGEYHDHSGYYAPTVTATPTPRPTPTPTPSPTLAPVETKQLIEEETAQAADTNEETPSESPWYYWLLVFWWAVIGVAAWIYGLVCGWLQKRKK